MFREFLSLVKYCRLLAKLKILGEQMEATVLAAVITSAGLVTAAFIGAYATLKANRRKKLEKAVAVPQVVPRVSHNIPARARAAQTSTEERSADARTDSDDPDHKEIPHKPFSRHYRGLDPTEAQVNFLTDVQFTVHPDDHLRFKSTQEDR